MQKRNKPLFAYKAKRSQFGELILIGELILNNGCTAGLIKEQATWHSATSSMDFHPARGEFSEATPPPSGAFMSSAAEHIVTCSWALLYLTRF